MSKKPKATRNKAENIETKPVPPIPTPPRQPPNHRQALQFLDNIVAMAPVSRQAHIQAQQALQQLSEAIGELERLKNEKK